MKAYTISQLARMAGVSIRALHHYDAWIEHFYPCSAEIYRGLGQGYAEHPEFRAFYDRYRHGLADFMSAAMNCYADQVLEKRER